MQNAKQLTADMAELLLKVSSMLMTSGANTARILLIINKFSVLMQVDAEIFINHKAFIVSLTDQRNGDSTTLVKRLPHHQINFSIISGLSRIAHEAEEQHWDFGRLQNEVNQLETTGKHPLWLVLMSVSLADGALARLFGGGWWCFFAVVAGTLAGLSVKMFFGKKEFNPYLVTFAGTFVAAVTAAGLMTLLPENDIEIAIATSVLFSIPGVPMINSFSDFIDGYFITGLVRFMHAVLFVSAIAAALFVVTNLFNITAL